MTDNPIPPDLAALANRLEQAWEEYRVSGAPDSDPEVYLSRFFHSVCDWLEARRAALDAGMVEALVSREAVEALQAATKNVMFAASCDFAPDDAGKVCLLLSHDLAPQLKGGVP